MAHADAGAEQLEAAARTGRLDDRVLPAPDLPNCSATAVVNGYTVDEPTMRIWSRAEAAPANAIVPTTATAVDRLMNLVVTLISMSWRVRGKLNRHPLKLPTRHTVLG